MLVQVVGGGMGGVSLTSHMHVSPGVYAWGLLLCACGASAESPEGLIDTDVKPFRIWRADSDAATAL